MFSFLLLLRECLLKLVEIFCCQLNLAAVMSSAGLVQIPCNYSDSGQAAPAAAAAIISSIITDAEGGWALLNTTTACLSPWLSRSAQVDSMRWVSLCVFAVPVLGSRLVVLTLPPSHSLCLVFLSPSHFCMPFFGKKSTLMKLLHLRVHSWFLHSYIRLCVCLCL